MKEKYDGTKPLSFKGIPIMPDEGDGKVYCINNSVAKKFRKAVKSGKPSTFGTLLQCGRKK